MAKNILFVDDDITSLDIMSILFEKNGYEVTRSTDGLHAISSVEEKNPDLIIVDLMMPNIDGVSTVRKIRENGYKNPVIAFTASNDLNLHEQAIQAGCEQVITKPCKAQNLVQSIAKIFE